MNFLVVFSLRGELGGNPIRLVVSCTLDRFNHFLQTSLVFLVQPFTYTSTYQVPVGIRQNGSIPIPSRLSLKHKAHGFTAVCKDTTTAALPHTQRRAHQQQQQHCRTHKDAHSDSSSSSSSTRGRQRYVVDAPTQNFEIKLNLLEPIMIPYMPAQQQ